MCDRTGTCGLIISSSLLEGKDNLAILRPERPERPILGGAKKANIYDWSMRSRINVYMRLKNDEDAGSGCRARVNEKRSPFTTIRYESPCLFMHMLRPAHSIQHTALLRPLHEERVDDISK